MCTNIKSMVRFKLSRVGGPKTFQRASPPAPPPDYGPGKDAYFAALYERSSSKRSIRRGKDAVQLFYFYLINLCINRVHQNFHGLATSP